MLGLNLLRKCPISLAAENIRPFSKSVVLYGKRWRLKKGYPIQWNQRGVLTDAPDYTFDDGKPTPYTTRQRQRILMQQQWAAKIVDCMNAVKFAQNCYQNKLEQREKERKEILGKKLKWKGGEPKKLAEELNQKLQKKELVQQKNSSEFNFII